MAALTWRNVDAPDFRSALNGFQQSNALLGDALGGISKGLSQFKEQQQQGADQQVLLNALKISDPKAYQEAINNGSVLGGVDPSLVSTQTLGALGSRASDLLNQAAARQRSDINQYAFDRTKSDNTIADNARAPAAQQNGIVDPALAALPVDQQQDYLQRRSTLAGSELTNTGRRFDNNVQQRNDNDQQAALRAVTEITRSSASVDDARAGLEGLDNLSPAARAIAESALGKTFGSIYAPVSTGGAPVSSGGKPGAAPGTRAGSAYDTTFNFTPTAQPITSQKIGDVLSFQDELKDTQGHSPVGAFQINQATLKDFGPKVLGKDWQEQELTPENQEKLGKAIFDSRKGGDLSKTWASLPNSSPGAYKNFSWEEIRGVLSNGEVGQNLDPSQLRDLSRDAEFEINRRVAQNNSVGVTADIEANLANTSDAPTIAQDLIKTRFPDGDAQKLLRTITEGQRNNPGLSAADVGSAIARSASPATSYPGRNFFGTTEFGGGIGVDDEILKQNLSDIARGKADTLTQANRDTRSRGDSLLKTKEKFDQAAQDLQALRARQATQPGISTDKAEQKFLRVQAALQRILAEQQADPDTRPIR